MNKLVKKEIESLQKIRDFGKVVDWSTESIHYVLPSYPPPAFSYAFRRLKKVIKLDNSSKKALIVLKEEEVLLGTVIGIKTVIVPSFEYATSSTVLRSFRPRDRHKKLCWVPLGDYTRTIQREEEEEGALYGREYQIEFKAAHEIKELKFPRTYEY